MLEIVQKQLNIHLEKVNNPNLLLACSGGVDSMVLFELLHKLNYKFAVAHCNFQLRGEESDEDENFIAQHCKKYGIPFLADYLQPLLLQKIIRFQFKWLLGSCVMHGFLN